MVAPDDPASPSDDPSSPRDADDGTQEAAPNADTAVERPVDIGDDDETAVEGQDPATPDGVGDDSTTDETVDGNDDTPSRNHPVRRVLRVAGKGLAVLLAIVIAMAWWPVSTSGLASQPEPTDNYDDAVALFQTLTADEADFVFEPCRSRLLTHDAPTDVVVVLFHGLTNCPEQFVTLGTELFDAGANVLIMRAPGHGRANSAGDAIGSVSNAGRVTAKKLRDYADDSMDIAAGLGEEVRVLGISMGGVIAAWTAQFRGDADRVVAVAPAINIPGTPSIATTAFMNFFSKIPNVSLPGRSKLDHAYPGESTRGLVAMFTLARAMQESSHAVPAPADEVIIVINPDDDQVDADEVAGFANRWSQRSGSIAVHRLPPAGLPHDVIDEDQPGGNPELVYPILIDLLNGDVPEQ